MLQDNPDPRINAIVVARLRREAGDGQPELAGNLMTVLATRLGLKEGAALASRYPKAESDPARLELMRKFLDLIQKD